MARKLAAALALALALLVQLTIVNGLALPGGGTPDLVLLCVVAIGMTGGSASGVVAGFGAGLALDLAPPASQLAGQYALVLCLIGYGSGRLRFVLRHSAVLSAPVWPREFRQFSCALVPLLAKANSIPPADYPNLCAGGPQCDEGTHFRRFFTVLARARRTGGGP